MKTTIEVLQEVKAKHHLTTDGQLSRLLGITRSSIRVFMLKKNYMGDETAIKVADFLDLDPAYWVMNGKVLHLVDN